MTKIFLELFWLLFIVVVLVFAFLFIFTGVANVSLSTVAKNIPEDEWKKFAEAVQSSQFFSLVASILSVVLSLVTLSWTRAVAQRQIDEFDKPALSVAVEQDSDGHIFLISNIGKASVFKLDIVGRDEQSAMIQVSEISIVNDGAFPVAEFGPETKLKLRVAANNMASKAGEITLSWNESETGHGHTTKVFYFHFV